jgi:hypothetical protein
MVPLKPLPFQEKYPSPGPVEGIFLQEAKRLRGQTAAKPSNIEYEFIIRQYTVLCETRTRVPYIASTTQVHRYIVYSNVVILLLFTSPCNTVSKKATSQQLPQRRQHHNTAAKNTYLSLDLAALTLRRPFQKNIFCQFILPL